MFGTLIRNSLQHLRVHNPARNAQFVSAINAVSRANYFRQDESSLIRFPVKTHYDLISQYWDETTPDATLAGGVDKATLKKNDLDLFLTYYKSVFDYVYDQILFNKQHLLILTLNNFVITDLGTFV